MSLPGGHIRRHLAAGVIATASLGIADGVWTVVRTPSLGAGAPGALAVAALVVMPYGLLAGLAAAAFERIALRRGLASAWARWVPDRAERAAWLVSGGTVLVTWSVAGALGAARFTGIVARLQDALFAARFTAFAWALAVGVGLVLALPATSFLHRPTRWLLQRRLAARVVPWVAPAVCVALAGALLVFGHADATALGATRALPYALASLLVLPLLWTAPASRWIARLSRGRAFWIATLAGFLAGGVAASASDVAQRVVVSSPGVSLAASLFARFTDVDGDGRSSLFAERDCAPFDAARGPLAREVPANGVDEDCDGHDGAAARRDVEDDHSNVALPSSLTRRYNVVLIVIDAFRGDRLDLEPSSTLTPAIAALGRTSLVFEEAFSASPSTRLSFPSFFTGLAPSELVWERHNGWLQPDTSAPMLAERMRTLGYRAGLVYTHWLRMRLPSLRRGYHQVLDARKAQGEKVSPKLSGPSTNARAVEFLEQATRGRHAKAPFFLTLYYDGPHSPYVDWSEAGIVPRGPRAIDRYEGELRYVDRQVGHLLDYLRAKPKLWPNTVVIVTSDHGEEFHEHGGKHHDRTCYRESTHVPLIVRIPDHPPAVVHARVGLVDIVPTVLALVGAAPPERTSGRAIVRGETDAYAAMPDARITCTYFANEKPRPTLVRAVRDAHWLYVRDHGRDRHEVYDTRTDLGEQHDLGDTAPGQAVRRRLAAFAQPPALPD